MNCFVGTSQVIRYPEDGGRTELPDEAMDAGLELGNALEDDLLPFPEDDPLPLFLRLDVDDLEDVLDALVALVEFRLVFGGISVRFVFSYFELWAFTGHLNVFDLYTVQFCKRLLLEGDYFICIISFLGNQLVRFWM